MRRVRHALVAIALVAVGIAGCAPDAGQQVVEPSDVDWIESPVSAPPPTPTSVGLEATGQATVVHEDGYTVELTYAASVGAVETSIVNDKPGEGSIFIPVDTYVSLTNTTPGRTLPISAGNPIGFGVYAFYSPDTESLLCQWLGAFDFGDSGDPYCFVHLGGEDLVRFTSSNWILRTPLESGQSSANLSPSATGVTTLSAIPEASLSAYAERLAEPDAIVIVGTRVWDADAYCKFGQFSQIVASTSGIPGCTS